MRIGIDFDNTIAKYDKIFINAAIDLGFIDKQWLGNKNMLKDFLMKKQNQWQILQGQVYGPLMTKASVFSGVKKFLYKANLLNHEIFIISHKTIYGHFDKTKTKLREQAILWLEKESFFDKNYIGLKKENIFFCETRQDKINLINKLDLDFIIDDLNVIFENKIIEKTKKILFSSTTTKTNANYQCNSWNQISDIIFTQNENELGLLKICNNIEPKQVLCSINKINKGRNSNVFKLKDVNGNVFVLKEYPNDDQQIKNRLRKEVNALNLLKKFNNVPQIIKFSNCMDILILEYIKGKSVKIITDENIKEALFFIKNLYKFSKNIKYENATEACLCADDLIKQIENRFENFKIVFDLELQQHLSILKELYKKIKNKSLKIWPQNNIKNNLDNRLLILSPSDFGFHNSVIDENNNIRFLDFEYFGFDDPVKLVSDFLWHPGMQLSKKQKFLFSQNCYKLFNKDLSYNKRLKAAFPLYGIRWCLIILNDFLKHRIKISKKEEKNLKFQIKKSKNIYDTLLFNDMEFLHEK